MSTRCQSCTAPLIWATTEKGKPIALDAEPVENGNFRLEERSYPVYGRGPLKREEIVLMAVYDSGGEESFGTAFAPRHTAHFATCKDAKGWRR